MTCPFCEKDLLLEETNLFGFFCIPKHECKIVEQVINLRKELEDQYIGKEISWVKNAIITTGFSFKTQKGRETNIVATSFSIEDNRIFEAV